jgi:hypothetical protein
MTTQITPINRGKIELIKTIALTALIAAVLAFIGGMTYANRMNTQKQDAVNHAVSVMQTSKK